MGDPLFSLAYRDQECKSQKEKFPDKNTSSDRTGKPSPQRRYLPSLGIAVPDQELQLMGPQRSLSPDPFAWPPPKAAPAQPLLAKPEPLAVIHEELNGCGPFVTKNKQGDLDHCPCLQNARLNPTGLISPVTPLNNILILAPFGSSISTRHSDDVIGAPRSSLTTTKIRTLSNG